MHRQLPSVVGLLLLQVGQRREGQSVWQRHTAAAGSACVTGCCTVRLAGQTARAAEVNSSRP
jgi:hypothetical protein